MYLDADSGFSIDKSVAIHRKLYAGIESTGIFGSEDFSLEVSSPGVDEPLSQHRQYKKNIGRILLVSLVDDSEKTGKLTAVTDESITIEVKVPKKKDVITVAY